MAFFGPVREPVVARLVAAADAVGRSVHDRVGRILEVGSSSGALYAVAEAVEGVPLSALIERQRRTRASPHVELALAITFQLAELANDLHDRSDVWDVAAGVGLSSLFPAGLTLDAVILLPDGAVMIRPLAAAANAPESPSAFRAPELGKQPASAASDVFLVAQTLRALLSGDSTAMSPPRLAGALAAFAPLLAAGLAPNPDERLGLFMLLERLQTWLSTTGRDAAAVVMEAVQSEPETAFARDPDPAPSPAALALGAQPAAARAVLEVAWPRRPQSAPPGAPEIADVAFETTVVPLRHQTAPVSEVVGRVFTGEGKSPFERPQETEAWARPSASMTLDVAVASLDDPTGETRQRSADAARHTSQPGEPPWLSESDLAPLSSPPIPPPRGAPIPNLAEMDAGPTVEMKLSFDAADIDKTET